MRLHSLRLRHFRGVHERTLRFASEGITVVSGPNEAGKSSVLEALDLLFDVYDSTTRREVAATQPAGRDVATEIEAEIEVGAAAFRYVKRFHRDRGTELVEHRPQPCRHIGRQAHDRALELLGQGIDVELWRALRVHQGAGWQQAHLAGQHSLLAALGGSDGRDDEELSERAEREARRYRTAKRGDPTGELRAAAAAHAELRRELAQLEDERDRHVEDLCRADDLADAERRLADELTRARSAQAGAERRRRELETAAAESERLRAEAESARRLAHDLTALVQAEDDLAGLRLEGACARDERDRLADQVAAADAPAHHAERVLDDARGEAEQAAAALARLARRMLAGPVIDAAALAELREQEARAREARAASAASSARLVVRARNATTFRVDDRERRLGAGREWSQELAGRVVVGLADVEVTVDAGDDAAACAARRDAAERELTAALAAVGAADLAQAERLHERREEARAQLDRARRLLVALGSDDGLGWPSGDDAPPRAEERESGPCRTACAPAHAVVDEATADAPEDAAAGLDALRATADAATTAWETARGRLEVAREQERLAVETLGRAEEARRHVLLREEQALQHAEQLRARLGEVAPAADLPAAAEEAARRAQETSAAAEARRTEALELARARQRCEQAQLAVEHCTEALQHCRNELLTLQGGLLARGADGLFERAQRAAAASAEAERRLRGAERAADAAALLAATLQEARTEARSDYAGPLRAATVELGRTVFGSDFDVELDEGLTISHRLLHGLNLPFEQLSTGAQEQLAVLARLACAVVVGRGAGAPVFLDDAFGYADPQRLAAINEVLSRVGRQAQVIVLTCDADRFRAVRDAHHVAVR